MMEEKPQDPVTLIEEMLELNDFIMVDNSFWTQTFDNKEDIYVQKDTSFWTVYFKDKLVQFSDDEMIEGLNIMSGDDFVEVAEEL